jgi:hypothetical protein
MSTCAVPGTEDLSQGFRRRALVKLVPADDLKNAGITIQIGRMKSDAIYKVTDSSERLFQFLQRDSPRQVMNLVVRVQQVLPQVTSILSRNPGNAFFFIFSCVAETYLRSNPETQRRDPVVLRSSRNFGGRRSPEHISAEEYASRLQSEMDAEDNSLQ